MRALWLHWLSSRMHPSWIACETRQMVVDPFITKWSFWSCQAQACCFLLSNQGWKRTSNRSQSVFDNISGICWFQRVNLELIVADYDRIGSSDPIGKVLLGYNRKSLELKHWKEMIENPRRPIVHWHVLKVRIVSLQKLKVTSMLDTCLQSLITCK